MQLFSLGHYKYILDSFQGITKIYTKYIQVYSSLLVMLASKVGKAFIASYSDLHLVLTYREILLRISSENILINSLAKLLAVPAQERIPS